jgi:eukaryotic-like serine/threonine-protein kinase
MAEQVGRVLGGRYRVLSPLGSGASAEVFLGDDVRLHRRVAIKMLHPGLADDTEFMRRFEAETRAAAALTHPNLLAIFDWSGADRGDGGGIRDAGPPYLITEYLKGGSLRALLDAGHRLTPSQALVVGLQVAQGLDIAHRQGLVHRDLTPGNLLFDGDGRLRVADIGLARAVAEAAMTEPSGAVPSTARYSSPEQVLGAAVNGASDMYSLCLVLVEAVTGKVPFAADTTIGTLNARRDGPVPVPDEMDALGPVLEPMGAVDPADLPLMRTSVSVMDPSKTILIFRFSQSLGTSNRYL